MFVRFLHGNVTFPQPPFPSCALRNTVTRCSPNSRGKKLCSISLSVKYLINYLELFCIKDVSIILTHVFIHHLFFSVWTHGYLFHILGKLFSCSNYSSFGSWLMCPFYIVSWFCFLSTHCFLALQDSPHSLLHSAF